jgi:hypothetical protein
MELSSIQSLKHKTKDRTMVLADLNTNLTKINISLSFDGAVKFDNVITCGIVGSDTTQHRPFALEIDLEDTCPIGLRSMSMVEVGKIARTYILYCAVLYCTVLYCTVLY